jgi:membrane-associated phospholipid phosphatase
MNMIEDPALTETTERPVRTPAFHVDLWKDLLPFAPLFAVIALLAGLALLMTEHTSGRNVLSIDVTIGRWIQSADIPFGSAIAAIGNGAGYTPVNASVALLAVVVAALTRRWVDVLFLAGLFAARGLNAPLKDVTDSPRPSTAFLSVSEFAKGYGFPSGHSMSILLVAGGLAYIIARQLPSWRWRMLPIGTALFIILATGYGRVHAGAHWPTDVIGGFLWGAILLLLAITFHHGHRCRCGNRAQPS